MNGTRPLPANIRLRVFLAAAVYLCSMAPVAGAQQTAFSFDPAGTRISFALGATLHTVHGTMQLKRGEIRFDPATGNASGEVVVDATSADTGNKSRDRKMHKEVLQSAKFPEIIFTAERVSGTIDRNGQTQLQVSGTFELDGEKHPMTLPVSIDRATAGDNVHARTKFVVPYVQWGLKNPSTVFLRVSDHVDMEIDAAGKLTGDK